MSQKSDDAENQRFWKCAITRFCRKVVEENQIIFLNLEEFENKELRNPNNLHKYIKERLTQKMNYIILDEIQRVEDFPGVVDSLYVKKNVDFEMLS